MRIVEHYPGGPHKLLRVETAGCAVNVVIDLHDPRGMPFIAVEVEPRIPDDDGRVWEVAGPATVLVHCRGQQVMPGDGTYHEQAARPGHPAPHMTTNNPSRRLRKEPLGPVEPPATRPASRATVMLRH